MNLILTGGTGFIGSAVLTRLIADGHAVTAIVRSTDAAAAVSAAGAAALVGDLADAGWLAEVLAGADGAIHAASPGDATSVDLDRAVVAAVIAAFGGTDRPFVHTGGIWSFGDNPAITEDSPVAPPALTAWRAPIEAELLAAPVRASVIAPGIVYGGGRGIPALVADAPRDESGALRLIGDGTQHWATVHVDDLASLYAMIVVLGRPVGIVIGASGDNPTVAELAGAIGPTVPEAADASRARLGAAFADALLLDQRTTGAKARSLGWAPSRPSLLEEFREGRYPARSAPPAVASGV